MRFWMQIYDIDSLIRSFVAENFGDIGNGLLLEKLNVKYFSPVTKLGIIRVPRDNAQFLTAILVMINKIKNNKCRIFVVHVSGTIKKCQLAAIEFDRTLILKHLKESFTADADLLSQDENTLKIRYIGERLSMLLHRIIVSLGKVPGQVWQRVSNLNQNGLTERRCSIMRRV
ncbi:hypothetical protein BB561_000410 [Smittium simulii]|uniref:Uncharacterized protein n=1 Tax=Smittium simulii TaxID=133385 RepID=A0A2T9YZD0_9FUNG|nr:hypothetical protein BB561_000410 [Smittium simulii]